MDCPNCHYQLADDVSECKSCGYTIRSEEPHHALDYSSSPSVINEQVPVGLNPDPEDSSTLAPDTPTPPSPTPVVHSNNTFTGTVGMPFDNTGATTNIPQTNRVSETKTAVPPLEPNRIQRWLLRYLPAHLVIILS